MARYYKDDSRLEAVRSSLDLNKTWCKQNEEDKEKAVNKWYEIIHNWYEDHKEYADSEEGRNYAKNELKLALRHLRTLNNKLLKSKTIHLIFK